MDILNWILLIAAFCLIPAGVLRLCRKVSVLGKIGPVLILYLIGMIIGNCGLMPEQMPAVQEILSNAMVPLAIPLMLFGCTFTRSEARLQLKVVVSGFLSVVIAVVVGYLLFGSKVENGAQVGGIISGMYTGGTLNAAALQAIFKINSEQFILINSYDIIISFLYFVFLFSIGIPLLRRLYGEKSHHLSQSDKEAIEQQIEHEKRNPYSDLWSKSGAKQIGKILLTTIANAAL